MCIDTESSVIYLLGGWDGIHDLSDFWAYHCNRGQWECLSLETASDVSLSLKFDRPLVQETHYKKVAVFLCSILL